jgi:hypothetical protein
MVQFCYLSNTEVDGGTLDADGDDMSSGARGGCQKNEID